MAAQTGLAQWWRGRERESGGQGATSVRNPVERKSGLLAGWPLTANLDSARIWELHSSPARASVYSPLARLGLGENSARGHAALPTTSRSRPGLGRPPAPPRA